jgi:hypothetical protein
MAQRVLHAGLGDVPGARGLELAGGQFDLDRALTADHESDNADQRNRDRDRQQQVTRLFARPASSRPGFYSVITSSLGQMNMLGEIASLRQMNMLGEIASLRSQ